jgi:hypothetical protein
MANSFSSGLIRQLRAEDRCIGVLTKPDRLPAGDPTDAWRDILEGKTYQLGHGYYVTKQPSQMESLEFQTPEAIRQLEIDFFNRNEPWAKEFVVFKDKFGTAALQRDLSGKLAAHILLCLPDIRSRVSERLVEIDHSLMSMPEPPTNLAYQEVSNRINHLVDQVLRCFDLCNTTNALRRQWKKVQDTFVGEIHALKPRMMLPTPNLKVVCRPKVDASPSEPIFIDSDDEKETNVSPTKKRKHDESSTPPLRNRKNPGTPTKVQGMQAIKAASLTLAQIRETFVDYSTSGIPGEVDPRALEPIIQKGLEKWDGPALDFLSQTEKLLRHNIKSVLLSVLHGHQNTLLFKELDNITSQLLSVVIEQQKNSNIARELYLEKFRPMTQNQTVLKYHIAQNLELLEQARSDARLKEIIRMQEQSTGKPVTEKDVPKLKKDLEVIPDPYEREVEAMAKVRAYLDIASMRFCDNIIKSMHVELFEKYCKDLQDQIFLRILPEGVEGKL